MTQYRGYQVLNMIRKQSLFFGHFKPMIFKDFFTKLNVKRVWSTKIILQTRRGQDSNLRLMDLV